jgi:hypothetical protein
LGILNPFPQPLPFSQSLFGRVPAGRAIRFKSSPPHYQLPITKTFWGAAGFPLLSLTRVQCHVLMSFIYKEIYEETVWVNQEQMVQLFQRDQSVLSRHIRNIFKEGELDQKSNMQKMHIANSDNPVAFSKMDKN